MQVSINETKTTFTPKNLLKRMKVWQWWVALGATLAWGVLYIVTSFVLLLAMLVLVPITKLAELIEWTGDWLSEAAPKPVKALHPWLRRSLEKANGGVYPESVFVPNQEITVTAGDQEHKVDSGDITTYDPDAYLLAQAADTFEGNYSEPVRKRKPRKARNRK